MSDKTTPTFSDVLLYVHKSCDRCWTFSFTLHLYSLHSHSDYD